MADNTTLNSGTGGDVIATDDIAGVKYQRVKVTHGADGAATDVSTSSGLPVQQQGTWILGSNSGVDIGDVTVNNGAGASAVPIQDGGNSITVDGTVSVSGTVTVDSELTTGDLDTGVGTDTRAVVGLVGSASGGGQLIPGSATDGLLVNLGANNDVTVTGSVTANAGTNLNTSALALESGGNLATVAGAVVTDDAAFTPATTRVMMAGFEFDDTTPDSVNEGDAGAARMSANRNQYIQIRDAAGNERGANVNASSQLSVSVDNTVTVGSHAVTNAGTFAVQESGAALTALQLIDDGIGTVAAAIPTKGMAAVGTDGTNARILKTDTSGELQVDVLTLPNVANAGTFAVQESGAALTALQLIDDAVKTDDAAFTPATDKVLMIGAQADETTPDGVDEGDSGALRMTLSRGLHVNIRDDTGDSVMDGTNNAVRVNIVAGAAAGGTSATDEATYTPTSSAGTPVMGAADETTPDAAAEGTLAIIRATLNRALHVNLRDASGNEVSVGGGTQYDEDTVHVSGDKVTMAGVVRVDTPGALSGTDGDRTLLQVDANGALRVTGGGGGTEYTVDAVAPAAPTGATFVMERDDALSALTEIEGDWTNPRASANGALWVAVDGNVSVNSHAVTNAGTFAVQESGAALTALQLIDDGIGTVASAIPTKGMAAVGTDGTNARILKTDTAGELQVDVLTLPNVANAGTFAVQESGAALTALQLIDDPVATLGTTTYTEAATKGMIVGAVRRDADTTLVDTTNEVGPLQMDANGRLKVEAFSGETLPVSLASVPSHAVTNAGTFAVQVDGSALTALQLIDDPVLTDDAAFTPATSKVMMAGFEFDDTTPDSVDEGDAGAARMSANRNQYIQIRDGAGNERGAAVNASNQLSVLDANSASALTSLQLIDDAVFTDDAAFTPGTSRGFAVGFQADETATDSIDEGDFGVARMTLDRKQHTVAAISTSELRNGGTAVTPAFAIIDAATSGDNTLLAAQGAGNKIRVHSLYLVAAGTVTVRFESGASGTALSGQMNLVANTGFVLPWNPWGWFETAANTLLNLELSGAVSVDGGFQYSVVV